MIAIAIFGVCAAGLLYIVLGYPVLLALLARWRPKPIRREFRARSVTVILAVHNGERWLAGKLDSILALDYPARLLEILVVSDGSDDRTEDIARRYAARAVELIALPRGGKARALNAGIARARGEILLFTDVRQELAPDSLRRLVACFGDPTVGVASGELVIRDGVTHEESHVGLYWRYEKWIRRNLSLVDSVLGATGCLYAMRRELAEPAPPSTLLDDVVLPLGAFFRGYRIVLESGARAFDSPVSLSSEFSRKVRTQAGVFQVIRYRPALLRPGNRMLLHFVSHKVGRLLLPYLLIGMALASFWLPSPWREAAVGAQAMAYGLSVLDIEMPEGSALKRISSALRTSFTLAASALFAVSIFFVPTSSLWKTAPATEAAPDEVAAGR